MKSYLDIASCLYKYINVPEVNDLISGKIYIGNIPDGDQKQNISIRLLNNPNEYLQQGYISLNIHIKEVAKGRENLSKFKQIVDVIIPLVKDVNLGNVFFQLDDDKGIFKDNEQNGMFFYNLKLIFQAI